MNYPVIPRAFFNGDCFDAYRILGAHPCTDPNGAEGWRFAVWAPGATAVEVCGGFDGWERGVPMEKADTGVWSAFIPGLAEGDLYKYRVHGADGSTVMRSDPYAFATELRPGTASKLTKLDFTFDDTAWMERRDKCRNRPLNIYELHAGSWKHKPGTTQPDGSDGCTTTRSWRGSSSRGCWSITLPMWSCCRWQSTPLTAAGATRPPATSR